MGLVRWSRALFLLALAAGCANGTGGSDTGDATTGRDLPDAAFEAVTPPVDVTIEARPEASAPFVDAGLESSDASGHEPEAPPEPQPFKVMSLNLRTGFADDGADAWTPRKAIVTHLLQQEVPDLLGVQEGLIFQLKVVGEALPDHDWVGTDRTGTGFDEYSAVFYDRLRFEQVASGTFWLSDTPDVVGSKFSEKQLFPRIVTWAHLRERATGRELVHLNTHVDTTDEDHVPERSCALIAKKIAEIAGDVPAVLTGDFNTYTGDPAYQVLVGQATWEGTTGALQDPWTELGLPVEGSFHGFDGVADDPRRIDWILHTPGLTALEAVVSAYQEGGHYPSDHFPVWARLVMAP